MGSDYYLLFKSLFILYFTVWSFGLFDDGDERANLNPEGIVHEHDGNKINNNTSIVL